MGVVGTLSNDEINASRETIGEPAVSPLLAGRYRVIRELSRGGVGTVYLASDEARRGREVAVRVPPAALARSRRAAAKLREEAERGMRLSHPHIVSQQPLQEAKDGISLVSDFVPGRPLRELLEERGALGEEEVLRLFTPLAEALDYAHHRHVVHRDVRPDHILLAENGAPFLADFGTARELEENMFRVTGRRTSGTLPYMSPEQLTGEAPSPTQDIYSFAATLYECLAGHPPFQGEDIAGQIQSRVPAEPPARNENLRRGILRGLAKAPEDRPRSCRALLTGETRVEAASPGRVRYDRAVLLAAALVLALVILLAGAVYMSGTGG